MSADRHAQNTITSRGSLRTSISVAVIMTAVTASVLTPPAAWAGQRWVVDDDGAQCGGALPTIAAALERARDGDTIRVCPGRYREQVTATKAVRIVGPEDAVARLDCFGEWPATLDTRRLAVLEPADPTSTEATAPLVTLDADRAEVTGLVFQNVVDETGETDPSGSYGFAVPAVSTTDAHAGYRVTGNAFRDNTLALEFGSSGAAESMAAGNCFRDNEYAVANQRYALGNAVLDGNATYRTTVMAYEIGWGYRATSTVTLRDSTARGDYAVVGVENSTAARISDNDFSVGLSGITVGGGNAGVVTTDNEIDGRAIAYNGIPLGMRFTTSSFVPSRSTGVEVYDNVITGIRSKDGAFGTAIAVLPFALDGARFIDNETSGSVQSGIVLQNGNTNNVLRDNESHDNGFWGIRIAGVASTGNVLQDNRMFGNARADARDESDPDVTDGIQLRNTWIGNECATDEPAGAICGVG